MAGTTVPKKKRFRPKPSRNDLFTLKLSLLLKAYPYRPLIAVFLVTSKVTSLRAPAARSSKSDRPRLGT